MCLLSGGVRLSGLVCALSPFICLPSCVSLHLSPVMWVGVVVVVVALAMVVLLVVVVVLVLVFCDSTGSISGRSSGGGGGGNVESWMTKRIH